MLTIVQATSDEHHQHTHTLFWEYLSWANDLLTREFAITLDIAAIIAQDMRELHKFDPPQGRLLLAYADDALAGLACMRQIGPDTGEVKRMYVRPAHRRRGIGRALLGALIDAARQAGYARLRLDSVHTMHAAHALYQAAGFQPIAPYPESEIPPAYQQHWVFLELPLR
jgi:GNAT superfamily N-acetyltransferase